MNDTLRTFLRFLFSAIGLLVASRLLPGIQRGSFLELLAVAVLLGALNATLGMLLKRIAILPLVCSFGCLSLFINGLVFWLAGAISSRLGLGFAVMCVSALANSLVSWYLYKISKETGSVALEADALHLKVDVYTSLGVASGLFLMLILGYFIKSPLIYYLDPVIAILVALLILRESFILFKKVLNASCFLGLSK